MDQQHRLMQERIAKLEKLRGMGADPYPRSFRRSHDLATILADADRMVEQAQEVAVSGRILGRRRHGKIAFLQLADHSGELQVFVRKDAVGEAAYELLKLLDTGDHAGFTGTVMRTRTGELSVEPATITLLSKGLRPLPEKWHGLQDKELRYRQRYVDLMMDPQVRASFERRTQVVQAIREVLVGEGFLEVETPILQPLYGGATARPFTTTHNALGGMTLYMRIANELYLKRLIVGGFEKVFEFGKNFRNEGLDRTHNPEFTMMECYAAWWDYEDVMRLVERIFAVLAERFTDGGKLEYDGRTIDFSQGFARRGFLDLLQEHTGTDFRGMGREEVASRARELGVEVEEGMGAAKLLDEIFSEVVEPTLLQPTFVCDHPVELSPLAKLHRSEPGLVERFEPFVAGFEVGNAFSELNDPLDQRARFEEQMGLRAAGDEEAQQLDEDFLRALEYGMPPTGGLGLGIDRIAMLFTGATSIRDVLFFPQMRPEQEAGGEPDRGEGEG